MSQHALQTWLQPDWPAPANVRACVTTRLGNASHAPYQGFNLADHVGDDPLQVASNRRYLGEQLGCRPAWLQQVHGTAVVRADANDEPQADGQWTDQPGLAAAVLTADCLPALFCNRAGTRVAAAHAGWRGLVAGVLEETVAALGEPGQLLVWLGPAIGPSAFEVGPEVREAFLACQAEAEAAFVPSANAGRWLADLYSLARLRLQAAGVSAIHGGGFCTVSDERFYSYRKSGVTGRFASLVWLAE